MLNLTEVQGESRQHCLQSEKRFKSLGIQNTETKPGLSNGRNADLPMITPRRLSYADVSDKPTKRSELKVLRDKQK